MRIQQLLLNISSLWMLMLLLNFALGDDEFITEEEHLRLINQFRRDFAKKFNVANMHELKLDKKLRDMTAGMVITWPGWDSDRHKTWRYTIMSSYWSQKDFNKFFDKLSRQGEKEILKTIFQREGSTSSETMGYEFLTPGQKAMGCNMKDGGIGVTTYDGQEGSAVMLCLFGPEGSLDSFYVASGPPGSKCDKGYHNKDGLCGL